MPALDVKTTLSPEHIIVIPFSTLPPEVIDGVDGKGLTVTTVAALAADTQPLPSETCTVYDPAVVAVIACVVAPLLQRYDEPALDVKTTLPPEQNVVAPPAVIVGVDDDGKVVTVTLIASLAADVQPLADAACTV